MGREVSEPMELVFVLSIVAITFIAMVLIQKSLGD